MKRAEGGEIDSTPLRLAVPREDEGLLEAS
jgi:hypothetical protein